MAAASPAAASRPGNLDNSGLPQQQSSLTRQQSPGSPSSPRSPSELGARFSSSSGARPQPIAHSQHCSEVEARQSDETGRCPPDSPPQSDDTGRQGRVMALVADTDQCAQEQAWPPRPSQEAPPRPQPPRETSMPLPQPSREAELENVTWGGAVASFSRHLDEHLATLRLAILQIHEVAVLDAIQVTEGNRGSGSSDARANQVNEMWGQRVKSQEERNSSKVFNAQAARANGQERVPLRKMSERTRRRYEDGAAKRTSNSAEGKGPLQNPEQPPDRSPSGFSETLVVEESLPGQPSGDDRPKISSLSSNAWQSNSSGSYKGDEEQRAIPEREALKLETIKKEDGSKEGLERFVSGEMERLVSGSDKNVVGSLDRDPPTRQSTPCSRSSTQLRDPNRKTSFAEDETRVLSPATPPNRSANRSVSSTSSAPGSFRVSLQKATTESDSPRHLKPPSLGRAADDPELTEDDDRSECQSETGSNAGGVGPVSPEQDQFSNIGPNLSKVGSNRSTSRARPGSVSTLQEKPVSRSSSNTMRRKSIMSNFGRRLSSMSHVSVVSRGAFGSKGTSVAGGFERLVSGSKASATAISAVELHQIWQDDGDMCKVFSYQSLNSKIFTREDDCSEESDDSNDRNSLGKLLKSCCRQAGDIHQRLIMQPTCIKRILWDVLSLFFLLYDGVTVPLQLFEPPDNTLETLMTWMTRVFWTLDMPISCFTGFLANDGDVVFKSRSVIERYIRTWFLPDVSLVSADWLGFFLGLSRARVAGLARGARVFRIVRLIRLLKLPEMVAAMGEHLWAERIKEVMMPIKTFSLVIGLAHLMACLWYGISKACLDAGMASWIREHGFEGTDLYARYSMSCHWALAQFVGGMDIVVPHNSWERTYAIFCVVFTFAIAAAVVSTITTSMTRLQFITGNRIAKMAKLRRYLDDHKIPRGLRMRVQRSAEYVMNELERHVPEAEVELLAMISEPLRAEIHFEEYAPIFAAHPLFDFFNEMNPTGMRTVYHECITRKSYAVGDTIFTTGEVVTDRPQMFFILSGQLCYQEDVCSKINVEAGHWVSEPPIWLRWSYRGVLHCESACKLVCLDGKNFHKIASKWAMDCHPRPYACEFLKYIENGGEYTDIGNKDALAEVVESSYGVGGRHTMLNRGSVFAGEAPKRQSVGVPRSAGSIFGAGFNGFLGH